jgi:hypothetical protein
MKRRYGRVLYDYLREDEDAQPSIRKLRVANHVRR